MRLAKFSCLALVVAMLAGCGSAGSVDVVDLNKVLDAFSETLTELDEANKDKGEVEVAAVDADKEKSEDQKKFIDLFAKKCNEAKVARTKVGAAMTESGDVIGFADKNGNNTKDAGEKDVFKIEIDVDKSRLIASDGGGHYRDQSYRPSGGFFTGYLIGSMLGRNRSYYRGARANMKPNHAAKKMSPKNYHKSAVSKAKAKSKASRSSSRGRSGSGGRSTGK